MPTATIVTTGRVYNEAADDHVDVDIDMQGWPPVTYLVELSEPMRRFDPETGEATEHSYIAVCCKTSHPQAALVFPSTDLGAFVDPTMTAMRTREYGPLDVVLAQLGYTLTD